MITRRQAGMTELIPAPREKREGVLRDHALDLLANLDTRLGRIEAQLGLSAEEAGRSEPSWIASATRNPRPSASTGRWRTPTSATL